MTVPASYTPVTYIGNGSTVNFSTVFTFDDETDIVVTERVLATGAETVRTIVTHYTVSGGAGSTGTVTAVAAPASTVSWTLSRATAQDQEVDYTANDPFPAETHEGALDKLTRIVQEVSFDSERALRFPGTDSSSLSAELPSSVDRANKFLGFDSDGEPIASAGSADTVTVSSFMATVLDDTTAGAALTTLGVSAFAQTLLDDANAATARATLGAPGLSSVNVFSATQSLEKGADIASAATLTLGTDGNYFDITGTVTVTAIAHINVGTVVKLHFDAALTLTHHSTNLVLPRGSSLTTAAGDEAEFVNYDTGMWRCTSYSRLPTVPASQANMEAANVTSRVVTPAVQQYHPGHPKAWWVVTQNATPTLDASYNVTSITDVAAGVHDINFTTSFSGTTYCILGQTMESSSGTVAADLYQNVSRDTGTCRMSAQTLNTSAQAVRTDTTRACFGAAFGDQ